MNKSWQNTSFDWHWQACYPLLVNVNLNSFSFLLFQQKHHNTPFYTRTYTFCFLVKISEGILDLESMRTCELRHNMHLPNLRKDFLLENLCHSLSDFIDRSHKTLKLIVTDIWDEDCLLSFRPLMWRNTVEKSWVADLLCGATHCMSNIT